MLTLSPHSVPRHEASSYSPTLIVHKSPSGRSLKTSRSRAVVYIDRGVGASPPVGPSAKYNIQDKRHSSSKSKFSQPHSAATGPAAWTATTTTAQQQPTPSSQTPPSENLEPARSIAQLAIKRHASDASTSLTTTISSSSNDEPMSDVGGTQSATATTITTTTPHTNTSNPNTKSSMTVVNDANDEHMSPKKRARGDAPALKILPPNYEDCPTPDLVLLISSMLLELISYNDAIPLKHNTLTRFHSRAPPGISVHDYLQRLTTHATLSPPILLSMVYYIDRLCALYPAFTITSLTVHRFLISSATVASKGLSDSFWTNKTYARVGGVSLNELALLELEFLTRLEWRIVPRNEVLGDYYRSLVGRSETHAFAEEGEGLQEAGSGEGVNGE